MRRLTDYITDAVGRPREQLTRGQHNVRYAWELGAHCWRQLLRHRAEGMAAELTYRTIFSLIPVVVLGLVMFRVVGGLDDVQQKVEDQLYSFFGVPEIPESYLQLDVPESDRAAEVAGDALLDPNGDPEAESTEATPDAADGMASEEQAADAATNGSEDREATKADLSANPDDATEQDSQQSSKQGELNTANGDPTVGSGTGQPARELDGTGSANESQRQLTDDSSADTESSEDEVLDKELDDDVLREEREEARRQTRASIRRTLHEATTKVASIDFASIGVFGLLLFVYAAVALADSTEYLFNRIYEAPKHRPVHIRLAIHWSIITLGSGLLAMSLYMSGQFVAWAGTVGADSTIQLVLARFLSVGASWVLLFLLYALMPNTNVSPRAAAIGSLVGSLLWEGAKFGFQIYVSTAVPYSALYGSLGLIPLFLFWIYVTWLIVLFGLILTYTLQTVRGRRLRRIDHDDNDLLQGDPDWMLPIMTEVAQAFQHGASIDHQEIADGLGLSGRIVHDMSHRLIEAGLLRRLSSSGAGEEDALTLARPAEKIAVSEILKLAHQSRPTSDHPAWKALAGLKDAQRAAASDQTLAQLTN